MAKFGVNADEKESKKFRKQQENRGREDESIRQSKLRQIRHEKVERGIGLGKIIFIILLTAVLMRTLAGFDDNVTFFGLLEYMSNAPQISPDWLVIPQITVTPPSWIEWGKDLINFVTMSINVLGFLVKGAFNFVTMTSWGLMYIFG